MELFSLISLTFVVDCFVHHKFLPVRNMHLMVRATGKIRSTAGKIDGRLAHTYTQIRPPET